MRKITLNEKYVAGDLEVVRHELMRDHVFRLVWEEKNMAARIAKTVREMRESASLSQIELAQKAGMPQPVVARLESRNAKRMPTFETIARVAAACNRRVVIDFEPIESHFQ